MPILEETLEITTQDGSESIIAPRSGDYIMRTQPKLIVQAIGDAVDAVLRCADRVGPLHRTC
jgi:hypothetical protein